MVGCERPGWGLRPLSPLFAPLSLVLLLALPPFLKRQPCLVPSRFLQASAVLGRKGRLGSCLCVALRAASRPPEAALRSQKSLCNTLAMAARPACLAARAHREFPEAFSSFAEEGGEVKGPAPRPEQGHWCWGRCGSFRDIEEGWSKS